MNILSKMKELAGRTRTLNGAAAHATSGDACLDLFAVGGGMRYRKAAELERLFDRAYIENPELAMKLLFHIRDIRGGMGERETFRKILRHVAFVWPQSARKNVQYIAQFGRWDDLLALLRTPAQEEAVRVIRAQLEQDLAVAARLEAAGLGAGAGQAEKMSHSAAAGQAPYADVSLLAKWLPSINTSSARTRGKARILAQLLGMTECDYRKMLSRLRGHLALTERRLTQDQIEKIRYDAVPARAMYKYRAAFARRDGARLDAFLRKVEQGTQHMHAGTLDPPEILRPYFSRYLSRYLSRTIRYQGNAAAAVEAMSNRMLEALWNSLGGGVGSRNALCVVDTSGSMYWARKGAPLPALLSQALGLYFAERCEGMFHNHVVTFESRPHLLELKGETLEDRLRYLQSAPWGGSTNLTAVFDLILTAAREMRAKQADMPAVLYILSDMEFNMAFRSPDDTVFEEARRKYAACGYELPAVVFHNVNAWQMQTPVRAHTRGTALVSGAGTAAMSAKFTRNTTPMSHMLEVLGSARYRCIHA